MAEIGRESRSLWELSATSPGILRALGLKHLPGRTHPRSHGDPSSMEMYSSVRRLLGVMLLVQREKRSLLLIFFSYRELEFHSLNIYFMPIVY